MKKFILGVALCMFSATLFAQADRVSVVKNKEGMKLVVNGQDFMVNGMNWDYFPIGTNYTYSLWKQPDDIIKAALDSEMSLLKNMGINCIRQYTGAQPKWITYIYDNYGIYTMLNHSFGRYGLTINGVWTPVTDYRDEATKALLMSEATTMAETYKATRGLLLFLLGNENNYGLFWAGAETEDFPDSEEEKKFIGEKRGRPMYKLMNDAAVKMKSINSSNPVAICNGDVLFIDIIAEECKDVDIYGVNMYRGVSFGDAFTAIRDKTDKPVLFTEFGADAFNAIENEEDQESQAYYMLGNWKEIYENAAGLGKAGNSIGGFTFQFSDGWWKFGQTKNLDVHDNNASWANGGYPHDLAEGENNMNEEWFGICAKGPTNPRGLYQLYPRAAYYALKEAHSINPMANGMTLSTINTHFSNIALMDAVIKARGDKAALIGEETKKIRLSGLRAEFTTFNTGGDLITTPEDADPAVRTYPDEQGFDHMQSYYFGVEAQPNASVRANVSFNVLGNVAANPIDEVFYENRGRPLLASGSQGPVTVSSNERISVYQAEVSWNHKWFDFKGFYRTGHYHWGYEGDFFGLYPEANYGPNIDIYNGRAPLGFEMEAKKDLKGLKVAFGPELWWGANPAILVKYSRTFGKYAVTGIFHEDVDKQGPAVSSFAVPIPETRRATLHIKRKIGHFGVEVGGIWGGQPLVGRSFQLIDKDNENNKTAYQDEVNDDDTWGGKMKITYQQGAFNWYAQGAAMGLVANGGADGTRTFTGWRLKDSGSGNQYNFLSGFAITAGKFQIAPNFLWQKPIVGPVPTDVAAPGRPRNIVDDPFAVRGGNRETVAGEILITFDPTPGTWMYEWDNDRVEDAKFATSFGFVYRHLPTVQDAAIGIFADGRTTFPFPGSAPAEDLWEAHARIVVKPKQDHGMIANLYAGDVQANGSDPRLVTRFGGDLRMIYKKMKLVTQVKVDDWGPFDYHRDFNLTYPLQIMADISTSVGNPTWFNLPNTRLGVRYTYRSLDQYSPRYCPANITNAAGVSVCDPLAIGAENGNEWEFRTYLHINIGK